MFDLNVTKVKDILRKAFVEDIGSGDITTEYMVAIDDTASASIYTNESCVVAGMPLAKMLFYEIDPSLKVECLFKDGDQVDSREILRVSGRAASILISERTVLNFLQRLSGVATITREFVRKVEPYGTAILGTRKTTPGLRYLEKYAVRVGGGINHRHGLYDMVLIKENHQVFAQRKGRDFLSSQIKKIRANKNIQIIIEVHQLKELDDIVALKPDVVLLDNFSIPELKQAVKIIAKRVLSEASGNVSLDTVEEIAATGVDRISIGRLTHSYKSIDMSLEIH